MFLRRAVENYPFTNIAFLDNVSRKAIRAVRNETCWYCLQAGQPLFKKGDLADRLYFLVSGALGVFSDDSNTGQKFVGHIKPGQPVGEMGLFLGGVDLNGDGQPNDAPHTNAVYAMRDCELVSISRDGFRRLVQSHPDLLESMMRLILVRLAENTRTPKPSSPRVYAVILTSPNLDLDWRLEAIRTCLSALGKSVKIIHKTDGMEKSVGYFDTLEQTHDIVFLVSKNGDDAWFRKTMRQADRVLVVARKDARPSTPLIPKTNSPVQDMRLVDILLIDMGASQKSVPSKDWRHAAGASRVFHWAGQSTQPARYFARVLSGQSTAMVFSGGGARAYAHIGAVRAVREAGIPIDFAGGTSMGAVVAACVAMGWDDNEIVRRIRDGFVASNPLGDYTLPIISLVKGERVNRRLRKHFGDTQIGDLKIPYFAVSTDLNQGCSITHISGSLARALRSSIALPGILPPIIEGNSVLVDGALINNFPADIMRTMHNGKTIGIDVARENSPLNVEEFKTVPNSTSWVAKNRLRAMPPIVSLLTRTATFTQDLKSGHRYSDIVVEPELGSIELRDWKAFDAAIEAGYIATQKALLDFEV